MSSGSHLGDNRVTNNSADLTRRIPVSLELLLVYNPYKPIMGYFRRKSVSHDPRDDVIMTSFNSVRLYSYKINPTKFDEDPMKKNQVIVLTSSRADFTGNDVTVTSLMMSS